jgi:hypothetical protein
LRHVAKSGSSDKRASRNQNSRPPASSAVPWQIAIPIGRKFKPVEAAQAWFAARRSTPTSCFARSPRAPARSRTAPTAQGHPSGKGTVDVKEPVKSKFKGLMPLLRVEAYLDLSEAKQKKLIEDGLVEIESSSPRPRSHR